MASTSIAAEERTLQESYIVNLLKQHKNEYVNGNDICANLGITQPRKKTLITSLKRKYPEIRSKQGGRGGVYCWVELPSAKKPEVKENPMKNSEGYSDPTAGSAISKVDKELEAKKNAPKMGEIWEVKHSNGTTDLFYILWSNAYQASGFYVDLPGDTASPVLPINVRAMFVFDNKNWFGDVSAVCAKPIKYLIEKKYDARESDILHVKNRLSKLLDIRPVIRYEEKEKIVYREKEVPVEKIVEKIVEKPVEKIVYKDAAKVPEDCVKKTDAVINDLLHQLDIYKDMVNRLLPKANCVA